MKIQEMFDKVAIHLLIQNEKSFDKTVGCVYRGEGGLMCAVGCLIKDEHYSKDIENLSVLENEVVVSLKKSIGKLNDNQASLLEKLQMSHDNHYVCYWEINLRDIAKCFNLNHDAIDFAVEYKKGL